MLKRFYKEDVSSYKMAWMIKQEDEMLCEVVKNIFKLDTRSYFTIRQIIMDIGIGHFMLDDSVELFIKLLDDDNNE